MGSSHVLLNMGINYVPNYRKYRPESELLINFFYTLVFKLWRVA